jgi:hypothetical protein
VIGIEELLQLLPELFDLLVGQNSYSGQIAVFAEELLLVFGETILAPLLGGLWQLEKVAHQLVPSGQVKGHEIPPFFDITLAALMTLFSTSRGKINHHPATKDQVWCQDHVFRCGMR